ncbi:hypothetical protein M3P05_15770 [Sansalvadorimonas sp. 2012CJ34-2]|uniref:Uncharacterized protein n=1 Tax=Parendozoicomonas callyspongiae TaxID=2942213 RepID=A0ABT0PJ55_9GAMM|nr:hypothetical protein [Sansalvadorimonas sp. 2012CJ34-2]MCL6271379.1 hypothetical protein [Sansalvadorimonas sp. 2012CJ34-2]
MGLNDSWAQKSIHTTNPMARDQVANLFDQFEIIRFRERDEEGTTALGVQKQWHTYSVIARKY